MGGVGSEIYTAGTERAFRARPTKKKVHVAEGEGRGAKGKSEEEDKEVVVRKTEKGGQRRDDEWAAATASVL